MTAQLASVDYCNRLQAGGWSNTFKTGKSDRQEKIPCFSQPLITTTEGFYMLKLCTRLHKKKAKRNLEIF